MAINLRLTRKKWITIAVALAIAVIVILCISILLSRSKDEPEPAKESIIPGEPNPPPAIQGVYKSAAIACDAVPCAQAGREILEENGTAVDAAIATLLCMGVYNAQSMGIGGGFVMTIYNKSTGTAETIDAREVAPIAANVSLYISLASKGLNTGPLSIAVPGEIRGYAEAHERHGRLPWKRLFEFAIKLASNGFPASLHLSRSLINVREKVLKDEGLRNIYVNKTTNDVKKEGDLIVLTQLAETLKAIAENGPDEMYIGGTATKLVDDIKKFGGIITMEDMRDYKANVRAPSTSKLKNGLTSYSFPAPGSGAIFNFILEVLDGYEWDSKSNQSLESYQKIIETFKYAYAYKSKLGDPNMSNLTDFINNLTNPATAEFIRSQITLDKTFPPSHYGLDGDARNEYGTAHMSVISPEGDAVSVTSTINYWFGAALLSPSTGIILNDEMGDFSLPKRDGSVEEYPMPNNHLKPKKRPVSSMCPVIIVNESGDAILVLGAAGGSRIVSGTAMVVARILLWGAELKDAIDAPRLHHQLIPNRIEYENGIPKSILDGLVKIGHELKLRGPYGSVVVGVQRNSKNELISTYDFRKGGSVDGF